MTELNDVQSSLDRMKIHMELRGLRPNTVSTFARCARRFLAHTDKAQLRTKTFWSSGVATATGAKLQNTNRENSQMS
ncbi:MAG TPA: hypothetical protein VJ860_05305 [Polyangia bacterium]|jgi:hypothetical protein|nr:hypothetical protein [Polyangia bacterium]